MKTKPHNTRGQPNGLKIAPNMEKKINFTSTNSPYKNHVSVPHASEAIGVGSQKLPSKYLPKGGRRKTHKKRKTNKNRKTKHRRQ